MLCMLLRTQVVPLLIELADGRCCLTRSRSDDGPGARRIMASMPEQEGHPGHRSRCSSGYMARVLHARASYQCPSHWEASLTLIWNMKMFEIISSHHLIV